MGRVRPKLLRAWRLKLLLAAGLAFVALIGAQAALYGVEAAQKRAVATVKTVVTKPHSTEVLGTPSAPKVATSAATPVIKRVQTNEPLLFITIDDGVTPDKPGFDLLTQHHATATLFLNNANIHRHYDYFKQWQASGSTIQNHTDTHPHMPTLPADKQKAEICGNADRFTQVFGERPTLFRPPFGEYNAATVQSVAACGEKYIVLWSSTVEHGKIHYGSLGKFAPGEIVLLHFTPDLAKDLQAVFTTADAQHLRIGKLEDNLR